MNRPEAGRALVRLAATCFAGTLLVALFLPVTASAGDQENSTGKFAAGQPENETRWTVTAGSIVLERAGGGVSRTLVELVPGTVQFNQTRDTFGPEAFNSSEFQQGFSAGPKVDLIYRGDAGYSAELSYFNIFNQSATKATGPDNPADWLIMRAPGTFWQTQDFPYQAMAWSAATNLLSAEANGRLALSSRVTVLAGFRWLQLNDNLVGTLTPPDVMEPTWKGPCLTPPFPSNCDLFHIPQGDTPAGNYPPFWNTSTTNNLYGVQVGVDGVLLELGRFSLDGLIKLGLFDNNAGQSTGVSMRKQVYPSSAWTNHAAFASEAGLQLKYQLSERLALKAGYELLWLGGVALAPGQIQETMTTPTSVTALGVNCGSNVLFHGATAGLAYSF